MTAALNEQLLDVARAAESAAYGHRTQIYRDAAERLGMSVPTLIKKLKAVAPVQSRRRREDAGQYTLTRAEALLIAATTTETIRRTGKGEICLEDAVETLRAAGKINAGRVDESTGEFIPLSLSAIRRALAHYNCHPSQLAQPTASTRLQSLHPNHVWQIDATVSRQYYLGDSGTEIMDASVYYRGKPHNFIRINDRRIIRYSATCHTSHHVWLYYCLRAESALNAISALIHAMAPNQQKGIVGNGVPLILNMDLGTRNATMENFCAGMGITLISHARGNARALGSDERMNALIETTFEAPLKFRAPVLSIEEMQDLADVWCARFNATRVVGRTGMTRRDAWLRITPEQYRPAPPVDVMRTLATSTPKQCVVRDLRIKFRGAVWDVSRMPGVLNGGKVDVSINPYDGDGSVRVHTVDEAGQRSHYLAPRIVTNAWGFEADAAIIGQEYKRMPETPADTTRREIERLAMQVETDAEAVAARKAKRLAFDGDLDPTARWRAEVAALPPVLPRAGTPADITAPSVTPARPSVPAQQPRYEAALMSHLDMALALRKRVEARGGTWSADLYAQMSQRWPDGVTEDQLDACAVSLMRAGLRAVGAA